MCGDQDWDVTGQGTANRICGAGLTYNEQQKSFVFNFGGQKFTISKKSNWTNVEIKSGRSQRLLPVDDLLLLLLSHVCLFSPADAALPADSKNKKDYQASIISFQAVYLNTGTHTPHASFIVSRKVTEILGSEILSYDDDKDIRSTQEQQGIHR